MNGFWWVEPEWECQTCVLIAGGPSLTQEQVDRTRGLRTIAINDAYRLAPWADILYFCDERWWEWHHAALRDWQGRIVRLVSAAHDFGDARIRVLQNYGADGLVEPRNGVMHGGHSGYQALHLAVHLGATRILLLGYDYQWRRPEQRHWFGNHPDNGYQPVERWIEHMHNVAPLIEARGIEVINCSPDSALQCFKKGNLASLLPHQADATLSA